MITGHVVLAVGMGCLAIVAVFGLIGFLIGIQQLKLWKS